MNEVVREMHAKSGLTDAVRASTLTVAEAEQQVLAYIKRWVPERRTAPLCGNSIGTDRGFLARDMPELDDHLHYRMVDVSSVKELARRWFPRVYFAQPPKGLAHRALADIIESVRELALLPAHAVRARARAEQRRGEGAAEEVVGRSPPLLAAGDAGTPGAYRRRARRTADRLRYRCAGSLPACASGGCMVGVAQLVEHQVVILGVAGSSPVTHPMRGRAPVDRPGPFRVPGQGAGTSVGSGGTSVGRGGIWVGTVGSAGIWSHGSATT